MGITTDLSIQIGDKILPNPVGVASGTFGYGSEYEELLDLNWVGAIYTKAVTLAPREGNEIPRIIETPSGLINSIGLANVGVDRFISEKMPFLRRLPCAIVVNVAGSTEQEYTTVLERLEAVDGIWGYEINVSCPNVKHGGLAFGTDPVQIERLTSQLRKRTSKPIIIKLTPNVTDITVIARAAENAGADALSCINTLLGMVINTATKKPVLQMKTGGLSGPAIRPVGVAMTYKVSNAVTIPVIGMGGIMNSDDAIQYLLAGASAIQIGTANFIDPQAPQNVLDGIKEYCDRENVNAVTQMKDLLI
ncbi:dihydroorotate dehydrogenase [Chitinispirillales bacterium ANBcel5]|uniref:dihydroorotate dehydrogenase n=1 Tax=Cellulosispirillum alkaliphilum TaxID=3039283 RepID=UPI002A572D7F|nr:dihydroorotate dehydrogenase [Chitinispirillales bacterium ANBcel5]